MTMACPSSVCPFRGPIAAPIGVLAAQPMSMDEEGLPARTRFLEMVANLIAQGIGCLRHGHTRFDLLWTFWTIPWDLVRGLAHTIGRRLTWIPLVQFAWRIRIVVGTIAVILEAQAGRWPSAIFIIAFIALSYVMPSSARSWERHLLQHSPVMLRAASS